MIDEISSMLNGFDKEYPPRHQVSALADDPLSSVEATGSWRSRTKLCREF